MSVFCKVAISSFQVNQILGNLFDDSEQSELYRGYIIRFVVS
jgi:hypothetical protein